MSNNPATLFDILIQFLNQANNLIHQAHPLLQTFIFHLKVLKSNPQVVQLLGLLQNLHGRLPESVTLALTVSVLFLTSLIFFRVGKSIISVVVTLIQYSIILAFAFIIWKLRDPLSAWLEQVLNQQP